MNFEKRLYRSRNDRMLNGVCGGLGDYFGIDATIVRLIFVAIAVFSAGIGMAVAYLVLAVVIPEAPVDYVEYAEAEPMTDDDTVEYDSL